MLVAERLGFIVFRVIALVPEDLVRKGQQVLDVILEKSNGTLDNIPEVSMSEL